MYTILYQYNQQPHYLSDLTKVEMMYWVAVMKRKSVYIDRVCKDGKVNV